LALFLTMATFPAGTLYNDNDADADYDDHDDNNKITTERCGSME
jgi:hypothetical protein